MFPEKSPLISTTIVAAGSATTILGLSEADLRIVGLGITTLVGAWLWLHGAKRRQDLDLERSEWELDEQQRARMIAPYLHTIAHLQAELRSERDERIRAEYQRDHYRGLVEKPPSSTEIPVIPEDGQA